ncbi:MAG: family 1 glycosylhydrolase [Nitrososphaerota archaeon]
MRGWENPSTVREFNEFVQRIVSEFKGEVDYWITQNEPVASYIGLGYLAGIWPPGFVLDGERAREVLHNLIEAHVQAYDTISSLDNIDADGDGVPKLVGFSHAMTIHWSLMDNYEWQDAYSHDSRFGLYLPLVYGWSRYMVEFN